MRLLRLLLFVGMVGGFASGAAHLVHGSHPAHGHDAVCAPASASVPTPQRP